MARITVVQVLVDGGQRTFEFEELAELGQHTASWVWSDLASTEIRSDAFGDGDLVGALPVDLGDVEQDDEAWGALELPLGDGAAVFAPVTVNGYQWALLRVSDGVGWVPVPFWEYPGLETVYELSTMTAGGYEWTDRLFRVPGLVVSITKESHFEARVDGDEVLSLEPGTASVVVDASIVPDPLDPDDKLDYIHLVVPTLDEAASRSVAEQLIARCGPGASVTVNDVTLETAEVEGQPAEEK